MLFPELRSLAKRLLPEFGAEPISLNLKSAAGYGFDLTDESLTNLRNEYPGIAAALMHGLPSWSGEVVSRRTALQNPVIYACNAIISETIGYIPASVMRKVGNEKTMASAHPMYSAMKDAPNDEITAQSFKEMLTSHCVLEGAGFSKIVRRSSTGTAIELQQLLPEQVVIDREKQGQKRLVYVVKNEFGATDKTYTLERGKPQDILHLRGLGWDGDRGYSVINMTRQSIGMALAADRNVSKFWANGGRVPYIMEMEKKFENGEEFKAWRADWEEIVKEPHRVPVTEPGMKYKQTGLSMVDSQANQFHQAMIAELCRPFAVSPHLVGDLSNATYSNIEHLTLEFVKMTLAKWLRRWEEAFKLCVLTPDERAQGYYLHFNINALLRGDFKTRMEGYASALQNGHLNVDEVRDLEDLNELPDGAGQAYHFQMNMQTTPGTGTPTIVEQGIINRGLANSANQKMADRRLT